MNASPLPNVAQFAPMLMPTSPEQHYGATLQLPYYNRMLKLEMKMSMGPASTGYAVPSLGALFCNNASAAPGISASAVPGPGRYEITNWASMSATTPERNRQFEARRNLIAQFNCHKLHACLACCSRAQCILEVQDPFGGIA